MYAIILESILSQAMGVTFSALSACSVNDWKGEGASRNAASEPAPTPKSITNV